MWVDCSVEIFYKEWFNFCAAVANGLSRAEVFAVPK